MAHLGGLVRIEPGDLGRRKVLSAAKDPMLRAIVEIIDENEAYWPLSVRQIHYRLLGSDAPLIHASKPDSRYVNDQRSYKACVDVCARGRLEGVIRWESIADETRPVTLSGAWSDRAEFFRSEIDSNLLQGYLRDKLQSQPDHIEIVAEKLTVKNILQPVAREFTMPLTISRGVSALVVKKQISDRYRASGKGRLQLLVVTDLDPDGEKIADDFVRSLHRDFGLPEHELVGSKVALTLEQVARYGLEPSMDAKKTSSAYKGYVAKHATSHAYELEALEPAQLVSILRVAILATLDVEAYDAEVADEKRDAIRIGALRSQAQKFFAGVDL